MNSPHSPEDTWDDPPIPKVRFDSLFTMLKAHPDYTVRPALQVKHADSALIETIETQDSALTTLQNLLWELEQKNPPFDELTDEQKEWLSETNAARELRPEIDE